MVPTQNADIYPKSMYLRQRIIEKRQKAIYPTTYSLRKKIELAKHEARERQLVMVAKKEEEDKFYEAWANSEWTYSPAYETLINKLRANDSGFSQQFFELVSDIKNPTIVDLWKVILRQKRKPFDTELGILLEYFKINSYNGLSRTSPKVIYSIGGA